MLPVIDKAGGTVDRVNAQLDKLDRMTDSAVDAAESVDTAVRAVSDRRHAAGAEGLRPRGRVSRTACAALQARHDVEDASQAGRAAAARREQDLAEDARRVRRAP